MFYEAVGLYYANSEICEKTAGRIPPGENETRTDRCVERNNLNVEQVMDLLEFVVNNSYFTYDGMHYHQVFGCAMGSPISTVITDLVMTYIEERALSTSPVKPCWWRQYIDDSNVCLKKSDIQVFHEYLNSIGNNVQFTIERSCQMDEGQSISFLDSQITVLNDGSVEIDVYRKKTHTNKYLDFALHNPMQHKEAVVETLLHRASLLPSRPERRTNEQNWAVTDLKADGYPEILLRKCLRSK